MGLNQPNPAGEEFLHHALFDEASFGEACFESLDLGVHVGKDFGDDGLFVWLWDLTFNTGECICTDVDDGVALTFTRLLRGDTHSSIIR